MSRGGLISGHVLSLIEIFLGFFQTQKNYTVYCCEDSVFCCLNGGETTCDTVMTSMEPKNNSHPFRHDA